MSKLRPLTPVTQPADNKPPTEISGSNGPEPLNQDTEKPEPDIYNPFDEANLKLPQEFLDQTMTTPVLNVIPVERPGDQDFIRVHPSEAYRHVAVLITHKDERGARYYVHPTYVRELGTIKYHLEQLFLYVTRQGKLAFWPIKVRRDNRENKWLESAIAGAEEATENWVCVTSNQARGMYVTSKAQGVHPEPNWPEITQGKTLFQLLEIAFKERLIMSELHPLIQKLRGIT